MTKNEFLKTMNSARNAFIKAKEKEDKLFQKLDKEFPRLDLDDCITNAENSNSIQEAITCFLQYGEYEAEQIWEEIKMADIARS